MNAVYFTEYDAMDSVWSYSCKTGGPFGGQLTFELRPAVTVLTTSPRPAMVVTVCGLQRFVGAWRNGADEPWHGLDDWPEHVRHVVETWPWPWTEISSAVLLKTPHDVVVERGDVALTRHYAIVNNGERGEAIVLSRRWTGPEVLVAVSKIIDGKTNWERTDRLPHYANDFEGHVLDFVTKEDPRSW